MVTEHTEMSYTGYIKKFTIFCKKKVVHTPAALQDQSFVKLAYLCDILNKLTALNLSVQDNNLHILKLLTKITVFKR